MDGTRLLLVFCVALLRETLGQAPHLAPDLKRWSEDSTWVGQKPDPGCSVRIYEAILMDIAHVELGNITIDAGGRLVFDPRVPHIDVSVRNIFVHGTLQIGSEDHPYESYLTITLTGNITDHPEGQDGKVIKVFSGGALEMHGAERQSWTVLTNTIHPLADQTEFFYFNHTTDPTYRDVNLSTQGVAAYTIQLTGATPTIKKFAVYSLFAQGDLLAAQINDVQDGEILMMTSQRKVLTRNNDPEQGQAYDALETLISGQVTGSSTLRQLASDGSTWAFIFQKGATSVLREDNNPLGVDSGVELTVTDAQGTEYRLLAYVNGIDLRMRRNNFVIVELEGLYPKLDLLDNDGTWVTGDELVIASTDAVPGHAETVTIIDCDNCGSNQIRINRALSFRHFGEVLYGAVDMRAEVGLLTRNVLIRGEMASTCPVANGNCDHKLIKQKDTYGGQIKVLKDYANVRIEHVELTNMGQQTAQGKYPIHFHLCLDPAENVAAPYVSHVSIHKSFARCVTVHGSHKVKILDSVCFDHIGHGIFLEDGGELDTIIDGNLVLMTRLGPGKSGEPTDERFASSFWITTPRVTFRNNHAAGSEANGAWFLFPNRPLPPSRAFDILENLEASRTDVNELDNNVAHSCRQTGFQINGRLTDDRQITHANKWQPLEDPLDKNSRPVIAKITRITGYMNPGRNIWFEGGLIEASRISSSDSLNGIIHTNVGLERKYGGRLVNCVVLGESKNKFQLTTRNHVRSGISTWKGPIKIENVWFADFTPNPNYDITAIAKRRNSPYFFSITTSVKNALLAFDDGPTTGSLTMSGDASQGWFNRDGEKMAGFTYYNQTANGEQKLYVVKPDHLSCAAADAKYRPNWRMCISETKYGNFRLGGNLRGTGTVYVLDSLPSAQLPFIMQMAGGPAVVLDGSQTYTVHFATKIAKSFSLVAEGIEAGDVLRVGVCLPPSANYSLAQNYPFRLRGDDFVMVNSLAELDATSEDDGKKVHYNSVTGMLYYKFINPASRSADEPNSCANGQCPALMVTILGGDKTDADCREKLYGDDVNMAKPAKPLMDDIFPANGGATPPTGWGAGPSVPFTNRDPVNGAYGPWSEWGACTQTCGGGTQKRTRRCDDPKPRNGGTECAGEPFEIQDCPSNPCPINGSLSPWTAWDACVKQDNQTSCNGKKTRVRTCTNPAPNYGGRYCSGVVTHVTHCVVPDCP